MLLFGRPSRSPWWHALMKYGMGHGSTTTYSTVKKREPGYETYQPHNNGRPESGIGAWAKRNALAAPVRFVEPIPVKLRCFVQTLSLCQTDLHSKGVAGYTAHHFSTFCPLE